MNIIRRETDYAIRLLLCLAADGKGTSVCSDLAAKCNTPASFTHKILKKLMVAGYVENSPGRHGGVRLVRDLRNTSLTEVINAIQGSIRVTGCLVASAECHRSDACALRHEWGRLEAEVNRFVAGITFSQLLASASSRANTVVGMPPSDTPTCGQASNTVVVSP